MVVRRLCASGKRYGVWVLVMMAALAVPGGAAANECVPTESDFLGPFYVSGMPIAGDINRFGKPGESLSVTGVVRSAAADNSPIANARIEIWQTDGAGRYYPENNGARSDYKDTELDMRGAVVTDADGRYSFRTVIPGEEGRIGRPKHIHYRLTAAGHRPLVTQHYVAENGKMPGGPCRSAEIVRRGGVARFVAPDIYLRSK